MEQKKIKDKSYLLEEDFDHNHLKNFKDWTKDWAEYCAREDGIVLSMKHWEIIDFLRDYYARFYYSPPQKIFFLELKKQLLIENPLEYLAELFSVKNHTPPAWNAILYAGLPRPSSH